MKILQVIPSLEAGGAERATVDIALALEKAGHKAYVASSGGRMAHELEVARITHVTRDMAGKSPSNIYKNAQWLKEYIKAEQIDAVHARSRAPAWSAYFAARACKVPFITTFHAAYKGIFPLKKLYNSVMARGDRIIAISDFIADFIRTRYGVQGNRIVTIPRGINLDAFSQEQVDTKRREAVAMQLRLEKGVPFLLMPGRLSPIKGQEMTLRSLARMKGQKFICAFVGPDQGRTEYANKLHETASEHGIDKQVRFISHTDLLAAYAIADLVLSPSQVAEGFGRVPVEAQAFGVPVIATALGATRETVKEGETGWLVPEGDEEALAKAIIHALSLPREHKMHMREVAIAHARSRFDVRKMCTATIKVYEDVLK